MGPEFISMEIAEVTYLLPSETQWWIMGVPHVAYYSIQKLKWTGNPNLVN